LIGLLIESVDKFCTLAVPISRFDSESCTRRVTVLYCVKPLQFAFGLNVHKFAAIRIFLRNASLKKKTISNRNFFDYFNHLKIFGD
jgi:hypothetical protein